MDGSDSSSAIRDRTHSSIGKTTHSSIGKTAPSPSPGKARYSIGELCDEYAVTARALRFYEDEALIAPERRGTARIYTERDRVRLAWILRGKRVGLSLADIKELLDLYDVGDGRERQRVKTIERCRQQVERLERQRVDIDATLSELNHFIALLEGPNKD